jgi:sortase system peptidoglycan-associated protein
MKHSITAIILVISCGQSLPVLAQDAAAKQAHQAESVGVLGGLAIGALLGGPPGAILSAAAGGWLGDQWITRKHYHQMQAQLEKAGDQLENSHAINGALQQRQLVLQQQLTDSRLLASTQNASDTALDCCQQNEVVLHFRSNSHTLEPHYQQALMDFVAFSSAHPERVIEIGGFSDRRGDSAENLFLSQRRVEAVVTTLRDMGLAGARFQTVAFGEREPLGTVESTEGNFFDRRVVLRLSEENQSLLSAGH